MLKQINTLLVTTIFLFFLLGGCAKKVDPNVKVLNFVISSKVKGMDPVYAADKYSNNEIARVYEGLLEYHYLKRPYTLVPNLAASMPKVSADGLTYTFKIKQGVMFHDDICFPRGKGRELEAADFVYSIKRLADPKLQSLGWWLLDGKIKGLNSWRKKYSSADAADYSEVVEGLQALDKYTLQFKLARPFPQFLYSLAMPFTFAVANEAVTKYGKEFLNHPVGTGPFILPAFEQSNKITYVKNPTFREKLYPSEASEEFKKLGYLADAGKRLPLVDKIVVKTMVESQPRWLNFLKGKLDYISIPKDNFDTAVIPGKGISDKLAKKGIILLITPSLDVTYTSFNFDHKLFQNKKLRQALSLAIDINKVNKLFYNDTGLPANSVIPPGIAGHIKGFVNKYQGPDLERSKKLLAEAGYKDGKGLPELVYETTASTTARLQGDLFVRRMALIGVKARIQQNTWPEMNKKINNRTAMIWGIAWSADYPDAENFLQLLYGPNRAPGSNKAGYNNPAFNRMFEVASRMQDSPERTAFYERLNLLVAEDSPWIFGVHRQSYVIKHGWLKNYISSDFDSGQAQYLNINLKEKIKKIEVL